MNIDKRLSTLEDAVAERGDPAAERRSLFPEVTDEEMARIRARHNAIFPEMAHFSDVHILDYRAKIEMIFGTGYRDCEECRSSPEAKVRSREDVERLYPGGTIPLHICSICGIWCWYRLFAGVGYEH